MISKPIFLRLLAGFLLVSCWGCATLKQEEDPYADFKVPDDLMW